MTSHPTTKPPNHQATQPPNQPTRSPNPSLARPSPSPATQPNPATQPHSHPATQPPSHPTKPPNPLSARPPGKYKPFSVIVRDEGGDTEAYTAGVNIVKSCIALTYAGKLMNSEHPWFRVNSMSKRLEWLHLDTVFSDLYTEVHSTVETRSVETDKKPVVDEVGTPEKTSPAAKAVDTVPAKRGRETGASGSGGAKSGGGENVPDSDAKKRKKEEQSRWTKLAALREKMRAVSGSARDLRDLIMTSGEWAWARNEIMLKDLDTATSRTNIQHSPHTQTSVFICVWSS
jgi:hypothetical protein